MGRIKERLSAFAVAVLISAPSHATPVSADAVLSHSDLSIDEPISFSVDFGVTFSSIQTVTIDAYWVNDGFGPSEGIFYRDCDPQSLCPGLGGYDSLDNTLFFRSLTIVEQSVFDLFLDGALQGSIVTDTGFPNTTATYGRLVFTVDGSLASVPEPASLLLVCTVLLGLALIGRRGVLRPFFRGAPLMRQLPYFAGNSSELIPCLYPYRARCLSGSGHFFVLRGTTGGINSGELSFIVGKSE